MQVEPHNAHCLVWDYERARRIAPYLNDEYVGAVTGDLVRLGYSVLQTHKLAATDREHVGELLRWFDPPQGARVLDAGCGVGAVAALMAEQRPDLRFSLLNISAAQLALAPDEMDRIHGDMQSMPVPSASFDAVMFCFSLGHGLLDACIAEAARVLRPGGVLFAYDLTADDPAPAIAGVGYRPHSRTIEAAARRHGLALSIAEAPTTSAADWLHLFGPDALKQHGLDRTWPVILRFTVERSQ